MAFEQVGLRRASAAWDSVAVAKRAKIFCLQGAYLCYSSKVV